MSVDPPVRPPRRRALRPAERWALDGLGVTLLAIGTIGLVVPLLPTFEFWLGAVLCFLKTRPGAVRPLLRKPVIGPAIIRFIRWRPFGGGSRRRRKPTI